MPELSADRAMTEQIKRKYLRKEPGESQRAKRRQYSAEEKVRIVIAGLRGAESIAKLCRNEGINQNLYYRWNSEFLEAGRKRLAGTTSRETADRKLREWRAKTEELKQLLGELMLENRLLKKRGRRHRDTDS